MEENKQEEGERVIDEFFCKSIRFIHDETDFTRVENWYPQLEKYTFPTTWISLTAVQAKALHSYKEYLNYLLHAKGLEQANSDDPVVQNEVISKLYTAEVFDDLKIELDKMLQPEEIQPIEELKRNIQIEMDRIKETYDSSDFFVRLSSRSPKDAALILPFTKEYIKNSILNQTQIQEPEVERRENALIYTHAAWLALKVSNAEQAVNLFLLSNRSQVDLAFAELKQEEFSMQIIIRKWATILPEYEFRVFILNRKLTGCTQYYPWLFLPELLGREDEIKTKIRLFWEEIQHLIPSEHITLDIVFDKDLEKITIIEVNPPPPSAGGGLYSWKNPEDINQVKFGDFEVRLNKQFPDKHWHKVHAPIREHIDFCRGLSVSSGNFYTTAAKKYCTIS